MFTGLGLRGFGLWFSVSLGPLSLSAVRFPLQLPTTNKGVLDISTGDPGLALEALVFGVYGLGFGVNYRYPSRASIN